MSGKNRYLPRAHISEAKFREVSRLFCAGITADQAAQIISLNPKTTLRLFTLLRLRAMGFTLDACPFHG